MIESLPILLRRLGSDDTKCDILSAMVPEYTLRFQDSATATAALSRFVSCQSDRLHFSPTLRDTVLTIHLSADATCDSYDIDGSTLSLSDLGFGKVLVDDGHAGQHHPRGSLIIYGSKTAEKRSELIDYLEFAPAMCDYFNIARRD